jgi:hypothetical protein
MTLSLGIRKYCVAHRPSELEIRRGESMNLAQRSEVFFTLPADLQHDPPYFGSKLSW